MVRIIKLFFFFLSLFFPESYNIIFFNNLLEIKSNSKMKLINEAVEHGLLKELALKSLTVNDTNLSV